MNALRSRCNDNAELLDRPETPQAPGAGWLVEGVRHILSPSVVAFGVAVPSLTAWSAAFVHLGDRQLIHRIVPVRLANALYAPT